ncbi:SusE domain-containing protein [Chitinophagaceae bacterium 26-R-25]|nr:SusE domain-containing protein [Chitinophagaceae bacterium 26-R-25]
MKSLFNTTIFLSTLIMLFGLQACDKKDNFNTNVTAVKTFFSPENNATVDLTATSSALFEWDQASAEDGGPVLYTISFVKEGGDFAKPLYTMTSDGNGLYNRATLNKETLNKVAKLAGLQPLESGKFLWTIYSTKGINAVKAAETRTVTIKRPLGIDNPPAEVYITGSATEGGTDVSKAIKLKLTGSGTYEIYTSLKPGTYHFVDNITSSTPNKYYIDGNTIREGEGETTVSGTDTKVYRMNLDFSTIAAKFMQIKGLGLWFAPNNTIQFDLAYDKNGIWSAKNKLITFKQESWGGDERYKFRMQVNDGTADSYEWWGSKNSDNSRPSSSTDPSFWYLYPVNNTQWDYCFKFNGAADTKNCDVNMYFSPDKANYTHEVIVK